MRNAYKILGVKFEIPVCDWGVYGEANITEDLV
jgi:hypothetical protein